VRNSDMKLVGDKIRRCSDCRKSDRVAMVETVLNKENYVAIMVMKLRLIILYMACNCIDLFPIARCKQSEKSCG
jgi:hypothetical protein